MSDPQPGYVPLPGEPPLAPKKPGIPGWAIALIAILGSLVLLCVVASVAAAFFFNSLGQRVSSVVDQVSSDVKASAAASAVPIAITTASAIGQNVVAGDLEFKVTSAAPAPASTSATAPDPGNMYYAVTIAMRNTGDAEAVVSAFSSQVQDAAHAYPLSLFGQSSSNSAKDLIATLPAGGSQTVTFVYEVPANPTELYWVYEDSGSENVVVKLK